LTHVLYRADLCLVENISYECDNILKPNKWWNNKEGVKVKNTIGSKFIVLRCLLLILFTFLASYT
jgi:hypothetical protein